MTPVRGQLTVKTMAVGDEAMTTRSLSHTSNDDKMKYPAQDVETYETGLATCTEQQRKEMLGTSEQPVFQQSQEGPQFRGVSMLGAAALVVKSQFGLGVLGIPSTFESLGFLPGMISLVVFCLISTWTGILIGNFRLNHASVHSVSDVGQMLFGRFGREFMGVSLWLFYTLSYGAAALTISIAFNAFTDNSYCKLAWVGMAAGISLIVGGLLRTMKSLVFFGYTACTSVFLGVWIVTIAVIVQKRPAAAPSSDEPVNKMVEAIVHSSFSAAMTAIGTQVLSLAGTASFFTIHAEMADQTKWTKSLLLGQGFVCFNYILVGSIVYGRIGIYTTSPALGSAGPLLEKIAFGISLPALLFSCIFQAHIAAKYAFVRILRNTKHLQANTFAHWACWVSSMLFVCIIGFVIACSVPFFGDLLGLIGALLGSTFTITLPCLMFLFDDGLVGANAQSVSAALEYVLAKPHRWIPLCIKRIKGLPFRAALQRIIACFCILGGLFITVGSTYGSITSIVESYGAGLNGRAFAC